MIITRKEDNFESYLKQEYKPHTTVKTTPYRSIGKVGKIIISSQIKRYIDYLHRVVGAIEWSGILLYTQTSGKIAELKNLEFVAQNLYPMDIGSSAATSFNYTPEDVVNMYDVIPEAMEMSVGMIHTHHNMGAFISNTDNNDLVTNAKAYNFYISLVVDFRESYVCKIAIPANTETIKKAYILDEEGNRIESITNYEEEEVIIADLEIEFEQSEYTIPEWMSGKIVDLKKASVDKTRTQSSYYSKNNTNNNTWGKKDTSYASEDFYNRANNFEEDFTKKSSGTFESVMGNSTKNVVKKVDSDIEKFIAALLLYPTFDAKEELPSLEETLAEFITLPKIDMEIFKENFEDALISAFQLVYPNLLVTNPNVLSKLGEAYKYFNSFRDKDKSSNIKTLQRLFFNYVKLYK